ncbi:uncharacterized protein [Typha latifolia]|uniref:uncharacterized protein isoform X1 n=1 Tax=Typha latifolia TaxID=4733 RepID=UPI003C2E859E
MVGDFMVCVDRIIASACFDPENGVLTDGVAGAGGGGCVAPPLVEGGVGEEGSLDCKMDKNMNHDEKESKEGGKVIECRICQEEGEECDMEAPCACNGTLKFAHRKCIQRWCNKKGDITCEICNQVYTPDYSTPLTRSTPVISSMDIRQSWGTRIDLRDSHFLAIAVAEQELLQAEYEEYAATGSSGATYCRTVVLSLMVLLLVRHILMIERDISVMRDVSAVFNVSLQLVGFFLPCYVIARSCYLIQSRRRQHSLRNLSASKTPTSTYSLS